MAGIIFMRIYNITTEEDVQQDGRAIKYIDRPSEVVWLAALLNT